MIAAVLSEQTTDSQGAVLIVVAFLAMVGSIGSAFFSQRSRRENSAQHGSTVDALGRVEQELHRLASQVQDVTAWRDGYLGSALPDARAVNDWATKLASIEAKLVAHVEWEEGAHGKYESMLNEVEQLRRLPAAHGVDVPPR